MPRPQKHVFVCMQSRPEGHPRPSCAPKQAADIAQEFYAQLQQRQLFEKIAVSTSSCLGPCGEGPSVLVYPEGVMYGGVRKEDVAEIFDQHLENDTPVDRLRVPASIWD